MTDCTACAYCDDHSYGATNVCRYGMSDKVGPLALNYEDGGQNISSETRAVIEEEVKSLTSSAYSRVKQLLEKHIDELHTLAKALLERETLTGNQIKDLLFRAKRQNPLKDKSKLA